MRITMSLDGLWKFCPAFDEVRADQRWMAAGFDPENPGEKPAAGTDIGWVGPGFDDAGWLDIPVPASWNAAIRDLWSHEGHGWYRRTVSIPEAWKGRRVEFVSEGANYRTVVYVNGVLAGAHEGGYNPFAIPIHEHLRWGEENVIAIAVENLPRSDRVPGSQFGWWNHGGLYRNVSLRVTDRVYIDDVTVVTDVEGPRATLRVDVVARGDGVAPTGRVVEALLLDPTGAQVRLAGARSAALAAEGDRATARLEFTVPDALLWSPDTPNLYRLHLTLVDRATGAAGDVWEHRIGLRTIKVEGTKLLLNGKPLFLKGLNRHEQYPGGTIHTPTPTEELLRRDLDLVQWLGANALRHHYPAHRRLYELCDERGILALVEMPLWQWGHPAMQNADAAAIEPAKRQLAEIIRTYKNHPCVFMWSVSNENLTKPWTMEKPTAIELARTTVEANKELVALAKSLDAKRPVVEVSNCWPGDPVHEVTDVATVNVYVGAPSPPLAENVGQLCPIIHRNLDELRAQVPGTQIIVAEFGEWTVPGLMTEHVSGELYQAAMLRGEWECFLKEPNVTGAFIWCFADYDLHRRYDHHRGFVWAHDYRCAYGIFDMERRPKAAAQAVREMWAKEE